MTAPLIYGLGEDEVRRRTGHLHQVARIDRFLDDDGPGRGARRIRLVTGGGLEVELHPDRALDAGHVTFRGVPVTWASANGPVAPALASSRSTDWLRSFMGGLLSTCGLDSYGPASVDEGVAYPLHGRVGVIPATLDRTTLDDGRLIVEGHVRQTGVFAENLLLRRRWTAELGGTVLKLEDTVVNEGTAPQGHMVLYHINFGWPLIDERATLHIPADRTTARDSDAEAGIERWADIDPPRPAYREQVFAHEFEGDRARVVVDNAGIGVRVAVEFDSTTLPALVQWKMTGESHYVVGLEPTNVNSLTGRAQTRTDGLLPMLAPGAEVRYSISIEFSDSADDGLSPTEE